MDSELEKILKERQKNGECIICGKNCGETNTPSIVTHHFILGPVRICEKHIKVQGE